MTEPTREQRRCMIFRHDRSLDDGCDTCGLSITFCHANTALNQQRCCDTCTH